ncbi:MAG: hydrolase [Clostridia bacterium]|nr:hydrolase [Clostridia bacterium]
MGKQIPPPIDGTLRKFSLRVPSVIYGCSGILVFGKRIKSLVFSTDLAIIRNVNADAVLAVYPFTPQPIITQSLLSASDIPVFTGIGGGLTKGMNVVKLALFAELQGATGVVVNAPTEPDTIAKVAENIDIPVVATVVNDCGDYHDKIKSGASILNVSAALNTPELVKKIRTAYPEIAIMATGGPTDESIERTIEAGANAITWTPPSSADIFREIMAAYRENREHP